MEDVKKVRMEHIVLNQLFHNGTFFGRVIPFIIPDYFDDIIERLIVTEIISYFTKYDVKISDVDVLKVLLEENPGIDESQYNECLHFVDSYMSTSVNVSSFEETEWLYPSVEKFIRDKAVYLAIVKCINILDGKEKNSTKEMLPEILEEALGKSLDTDIGHDYIENADDRYTKLHQEASKYPCSLSAINKITDNGFEKKTLNLFVGSPGSGKSILLAQLAKDYMEEGYNVLFVSLEMSQEKIATRIDANSMNVNVNRIKYLERKDFMGRVNQVKAKARGRLIIKEYPPSTINCSHIDSLIKELKIKKSFVPDVIIIDYLGIMQSKRVPASSGLYQQGKAVAEEMRALMVKNDVVGFSVVQFNRGSSRSSDATASGIAESAGIEHTADFIGGLLITEELREKGRCVLLQMKNRYGDVNAFKRQMLILDTNMMRYSDCSDEVPDDITPSKKKIQTEEDMPLFDMSTNSATLPTKKKGGYGGISF